jgi:hypothetical protein
MMRAARFLDQSVGRVCCPTRHAYSCELQLQKVGVEGNACRRAGRIFLERFTVLAQCRRICTVPLRQDVESCGQVGILRRGNNNCSYVGWRI